MTDLVLRNTTPSEKRRLPKSFHSYVAFNKESRDEIADIKWAYRPKNAGGSAYQARVVDPGRSDGQRVSVWSKDLEKLCEIVRYVHTREGEAPRHWR
jgi:hypothetical protein